jgi:hemolysin III
MTKLHQIFLEPVNALTHLVAMIASIIGVFLLVYLTWDEWFKRLTVIIYGSSLILLYLASTLLHGVKTSRKIRFRLNRLDHMAIFLSIAGTYTPIAFTLLLHPWRWVVLGLVWSTAVIGMGYKLFSVKIHGFLNAFIYMILGWGGVIPFVTVPTPDLFQWISWPGFILLLVGGLIYSVGFVIYYRRQPDPWPRVFGHHEIWHLCVMGGSLCHYLFILHYVVPYCSTCDLTYST